MKKVNYYVIGGQYASYCYGGSETLLGAKRIAGKHEEHWDNWQGWRRPKIYAAEDCELATNFYGEQMVPKADANPVARYDSSTGAWVSGADLCDEDLG